MPKIPPEFLDPRLGRSYTYPTQWPTPPFSWEVWTGKRWEPMTYMLLSPYPFRVVSAIQDSLILEGLDPLAHCHGCSKPRFKVRQCL